MFRKTTFSSSGLGPHGMKLWPRSKKRAMPTPRALTLYRDAARRFDEVEAFIAHHRHHFETTHPAEAELSRRGGTHAILHAGTDTEVDVEIDSPAKFFDLSNFRESFIDPMGLNARQRQLYLASLARMRPGNAIAVFEQGTPFAAALKAWPCSVATSIYSEDPGARDVQDMQAMGYADGAFDAVIHGDNLEHVPDVTAALSETLRVLRPGGATIFTTPLFPLRRSILRAAFDRTGQLVRLLPDEIHGDYLTGGVLAFHNFGWDLIGLMRDVGFAEAYVEVCYMPKLGLFSSNCPIWTTHIPPQPGNMLPLVIVGRKAG